MRSLMRCTQVETNSEHGDNRDDQEQKRNPSARLLRRQCAPPQITPSNSNTITMMRMMPSPPVGR